MTIYWIAGGIAKAGGIDAAQPRISRRSSSLSHRPGGGRICRDAWRPGAVEKCGTLDRAVEAAARDAPATGSPGAVVLLSPACASFDHYPNFEVRGDAFVQAVVALPGMPMTEEGEMHADQP